jgi:hypothetical protein
MEREARLNTMESFVKVLKVLDDCQSKFSEDANPFMIIMERENAIQEDKDYAMRMINENQEFYEKCESAKEIIIQKLFGLVD